MTVDDEFRVPDQLYVGYRKRTRDDKTLRFGYVIPYGENNRSFKNRKSTVDRRADGTPEIIDNKPLAGFEIKFMVSTYRTSNKKWRLQDPRGFMVEISSENLSRIFDKVTIDRGVIQEECAWCFDSQGDNWLLPAGCEEYEEGRKLSKLRNKRISLRDVNRGDKVMLHDGRTVRYLGGLYFLDQKSDVKRRSSRRLGEIERCAKVKRWYFFLEEDSNGEFQRLDSKSSIKVSHIIEKTSSPLTGKQAERIANKLERQQGSVTWPIQGPSFFRASKFSPEDVEIDTRPYTLDKEAIQERREVVPFLCADVPEKNYSGEEPGTYFVSYVRRNDGQFRLVKFDQKELESRLAIVPLHQKRSSTYGRSSLKKIKIPFKDVGHWDLKEVVCRVDGDEYTTFM